MSLYRKYRPDNFENLVGQSHVKETLINAIKTGHIAQGYLFTGPRGTGKTSTARLIAKALSCPELGDGFEPCSKCEFCTDIASGRLIDLIEIDAASNRGIDEVRELKEKIDFAPSRSKVKVYIIDEVHMMTKEAFNALLKTLEEPPDHAYFILATTEVHKIPDTIISRCQRFDFKRIEVADLVSRLKFICKAEGLSFEENALETIARYVDGGMRDAIGLIEQLTLDGNIDFAHVKSILGMADVSLLDDLYTHLVAQDSEAAIKVVHSLHDQGCNLVQFLHEFLCRLREEMLIAVRENGDVSSMLRMISCFQEAKKMMSSDIPQLSLEIACVKICGAVVASAPVKAAPVAAVKAARPDVKPEVAPVVAKPVEVKKAVSEPKSASVVAEKEVSSTDSATTSEVPDFDFDHILEKWPRVTERIKFPSLRMSLKSGRPVGLKGNDLTLQFSTNFHRDKVMESDNRVELERVVKELFEHAVKVTSTVKAVEIAPTMQEDVSFSAPAMPDPEPLQNVAGSAVDSALDIFGGEIVG